MDEIRIRDLQVYAYHGVLEEETRLGQQFFVNATLYLNTVKAGISDNLEESVSYADVSLFMDKFMKENTFQLLEAVAEQMARAILIEFPLELFPFNIQEGYFIVTLLPKLPSTHSINPFSSTIARLVTKL